MQICMKRARTNDDEEKEKQKARLSSYFLKIDNAAAAVTAALE